MFAEPGGWGVNNEAVMSHLTINIIVISSLTEPALCTEACKINMLRSWGYSHQHGQWDPCFTVTLQSTSINMYSGAPVLRSLYRVHPSTCTVEPLFYGHSTEYIHQHIHWNPCFTVTLQSTSINIYSGSPVLQSLYRVHPSTCTVEPLFYGHSTEYIHQHVQWNPLFYSHSIEYSH